MILKSAITSLLVKNGWRRSGEIPLDDENLSGRYGYDEEELIKENIRKVRDFTMTSFERLATLWHQVTYLDRNNIEGALVECGVWKGGSVGMMAHAHLKSSPTPTRELHLFDSFEGLPEPEEVDGQIAKEYAGNSSAGKMETIGECVGPKEFSEELLENRIKYPKDLIHYHVGWFQDTMPKDKDQIDKIALLRLDGDWYESTIVCLDNLYDKVVPGGIIVMDDYGAWEGCKKATDEFIAKSSEPILLNHIDCTGRYWIKAR